MYGTEMIIDKTEFNKSFKMFFRIVLYFCNVGPPDIALEDDNSVIAKLES